MINTDTILAPCQLTKVQLGARTIMFKLMQGIEKGSLTVTESFHDLAPDSPSYVSFGQSSERYPDATLIISDPNFYTSILKRGSIGAGEAYMEGLWNSPDLTDLVEVIALNQDALDRWDGNIGVVTKWIEKVAHWLKRNTFKNSKENIHAHYDLGNDFYKLFLDKNMLYSSAIYSQGCDLEQAQINKMDRLCQQMSLTENDHVLEIGTGWGAMAIYMAKHYGCQVTTTTISQEQHDYTAQRILEEGLTDKIELLDQDYRLLEGQYDKIVSIEMVEAVGKQYLASYLSKCYSMLKPNGLLAIQAITIADQRYRNYSNSVDFIQKYIFPGGLLPSVTNLLATTTQHTGLVLRDLHDIGLDYAQTLCEWRERFEVQISSVRQQGFDERFIRMWRYYLCYCEGGFKAKSISTVHLTFERF